MSKSHYPSSSHYQHILKSYLKTKLSTAAQLQNLVLMLSFSKLTFTPRVNRYTILKGIEGVKDLIQIFKYGILLQRSFVGGWVPDSNIILKAIKNKLHTIHLWKEMGEDAAKFLKDKILVFYLGYLEKRVYDLFSHQNDENYHETQPNEKRNLSLLNKENQKQVCTSTSNRMNKPTSRKSKTTSIRSTNPEAREDIDIQMEAGIQSCFYLINLLNKALSFWPSILSFIRYFGGYFGCVLDFNITMGMDLAEVYDRLINQSKKIKQYLQKLETQNQEVTKQIELIEEMRILFNEIEKVNEQLYLVYYNCYYWNNLKRYAPKFIDTQNILKFMDQKLVELNKQKRVSEFFEVVRRERSSSIRKSINIVRELTKSKLKNMNRSEKISQKAISLRYSHLQEKSNTEIPIRDSQHKKLRVSDQLNLNQPKQEPVEDKSNIKDNDESTDFQFVQSEDQCIQSEEIISQSDGKSEIEEDVQLLIEMSIVVDNIKQEVIQSSS